MLAALKAYGLRVNPHELHRAIDTVIEECERWAKERESHRLPDRRRRREGRLARAATRPRLRGPLATVGNRLQVRAARRAHEAARHHRQRRQDRRADAAGGARAGKRRRGRDLPGHAPQRGLRQGEGHPHRRHGRRRAGWGRDPAGRQSHHRGTQRRRTRLRDARQLAPSATSRSRAPRARPSPAA